MNKSSTYHDIELPFNLNIASISLFGSKLVYSEYSIFYDDRIFRILGGDGWGLQTGAYINFPQSRLFSIQTGLLLHTAGNSFSYGDDWNIDFFVPVYASFHIPLSDKVNLRLNAGAYTGSGEYWNLGATAAAGIEVKRFYVGVNYFQNCVNDRDLKLGLSVGYKFTLF